MDDGSSLWDVDGGVARGEIFSLHFRAKWTWQSCAASAVLGQQRNRNYLQISFKRILQNSTIFPRSFDPSYGFKLIRGFCIDWNVKTALYYGCWYFIMTRYQLVALHSTYLHFQKKRKVSQERANQSRRRRRKRPDDWWDEKSLKDAGQFLGCKKVLSN